MSQPFDEGGAASGKVDVTITCKDVPELPAPLVIRGSFAGVPVE